MNDLDFGRTAGDYRRYRAGFPKSFFEALKSRGLIVGSEDVADLGTGTGTIARGLAGMGCKVTGVDPSLELLGYAADIAGEDGLDVTWLTGTAEATRLKTESVDVITAGQCWHWFEPEAAIAEVRRILKPDGLLLIAHFDWLPLLGNVVWYTEKLIEEVNSAWDMGDGCGIYPEWFRHMGHGGFSEIESFTYQESVPYSHEAWRGRIRASAGIGGTLDLEKVEAFDRQHATMLVERFPQDILEIPHQVFVIHGRK